MLLVSGTIDLHPDDLAAFLAAVEAVTGPSRAEADCVAYQFSQDVADPNRICLFEIWTDKAAIDKHMQTPHFLAYRERTAKLRQTRNLLRYAAEKLPI